MKKLIGLMVVVAVSAQAIPPRQEAVLIKSINQTANLMPPVIGRPVFTELEVAVVSTGCTKARDFKVQVRRTRSGQFLEIVRINPDLCEMVEHQDTVVLETRDLDLATTMPIVAVNPLLSEESVVH